MKIYIQASTHNCVCEGGGLWFQISSAKHHSCLITRFIQDEGVCFEVSIAAVIQTVAFWGVTP